MRIFDVWAEWCAPCKKFAPIFERVAEEYKHIEFVKINADENLEFLNIHDIRSIPTILVLDSDNNEMFRHTGILSAANLRYLLDTLGGH